MRIRYTPNGTTGYRCQLTNGVGFAVTIDRNGDDSSANVSPDGLPSQGAVAALERYAALEYERRRSRSADQRERLEAEVERWHEAALDVADLLHDLTEQTEHGWCSDCMTKSDHQLAATKTKFRTRRYICTECGSPTGRCDVPKCPSFADRGGGPKQRARFCAEHEHQIPSFEKLTESVDTLEEYVPWLEFERFNAKRFSTVAAVSIAGVSIIGPLTMMAAPAIGGMIGAYAGLSGAAATSSGLATLGGGSLAAGGLGMAGGTSVVTAIGASLGGATGASVASAYVRSDKSLQFEKIENGGPTTVIFANGFLSEGEAGWGDWRRLISERYPDADVYRLKWGAKELKSLTGLMSMPAIPLTMKSAIALASQATKSSTKLLGPVGAAFGVAGLAKNPWHVARTRASMTGAILADAIVRADLQSVVLVGFSLGGRVAAAAAESLATRGDAPRVESLHLLGAAVGTGRDWRAMSNAVSGRIFNYHSSNDMTLRALYRVAEAGTEAVGTEGIPAKSPKIKNVDVSKHVGGHREYLRSVTLR